VPPTAFYWTVERRQKSATVVTGVRLYLQERFAGSYWLEDVLQLPGMQMLFELEEGQHTVTLKSILAAAPGSGYGRPIVEALRDYADESGKTLQIVDIVNEVFFDGFTWWTDRLRGDEDGAGEASYDPR
jgi:hypothetical protein